MIYFILALIALALLFVIVPCLSVHEDEVI